MIVKQTVALLRGYCSRQYHHHFIVEAHKQDFYQHILLRLSYMLKGRKIFLNNSRKQVVSEKLP